jgi:4-hydroxybenzoate polyprenyltransferase
MNDLLDLESDRKHTEKCYRPLAVGSVGIPVGVVVSLIFPLLAQVLAFIGAGWPGVFMILGYWLVTTYYSLHGKRIPLVDVFLLAGLYTFRAFGGALIIPTGLSPWMVAFLLFLFLGLACLKRFSELIALPDVHDGTVSGRGYIRSDYSLVAIMGVGAAFIASLIVCLYATSSASLLLYAHPVVLMGIAPIVLFGLLRLWLQSWRRMMHSDPVLHALKDKISYLLIVLCAGCIMGGN